MTTMHIRRFSARYRLPESQTGERHRLDRVLRAVVGETLERAMEIAGVDPREEVCIRELYVPLTLRLSTSDDGLAAAWSVALAEALACAARGSGMPRQRPGAIVRYRSRIHALIDMAGCVARGDTARIWAWKRIGLWSGSDDPGEREAIRSWVFAMLRESASIVPVLRAVAERVLRGHAAAARLLARISGEEWRSLAQEALIAAKSAASLLDGTRDSGIHEASARAKRLIASSPLARAIAASGGLTAVAPAGVRRAQAALILLEREPGLMQGTARARVLLDNATDLLFRPSAGIERDEETPREEAVDRSRRESPVAKSATDTPRRTSENKPFENAAPDQDGEAELWEPASAPTRFGGLLYLVNLLRDLDLPAEMAGPEWGPRPFRWVLHQLGTQLSGAGAGDPAVLAFCGLGPDAASPLEDEPPATEKEQTALEALRERLAAALLERLREDGLTPGTVLPWLCRRDAEIAADPGWIDVRLSLRDVSVPIRRAALDLNPGYVEWLGVVVRFVYA